jgi:hypothetical protein
MEPWHVAVLALLSLNLVMTLVVGGLVFQTRTVLAQLFDYAKRRSQLRRIK